MRSLTKRIRGNFLSGIGIGSFAMIGKNPFSNVTMDKKARLFLATEIGEWCQLSCRHCIYHEKQLLSPHQASPQRSVVEGLEKFLETTGPTPTWLSFAGKEPTVFPDELTRLAEIARQKSGLVILMTNGLRLQGDLLEKLEKTIGLFDVSVDGCQLAHDWMRGEGAFNRTMDRIENILNRGKVPVAIIATAVHAKLNGGDQIDEVVALASYLSGRFGDSVSLSVSLYYDRPNHPMLLSENDLVKLADGLGEAGVLTRILWTANYAFQWPNVARRLGLDGATIFYDQQTAIPFIQKGKLHHILFNLTEAPLLGVRVSNRGNIYLGCNHLVLGEEAGLFRISSLSQHNLQEIVASLVRGDNGFLQRVADIDQRCEKDCSYFDACGGGDSLSGVYFNNAPVDPFCPLLQ